MPPIITADPEMSSNVLYSTEQFRDPVPNHTAALPKRLNEQDSKRIRCPDAKDIAAGIGRRFDQQFPAGAPQIGHEPGMG